MCRNINVRQMAIKFELSRRPLLCGPRFLFHIFFPSTLLVFYTTAINRQQQQSTECVIGVMICAWSPASNKKCRCECVRMTTAMKTKRIDKRIRYDCEWAETGLWIVMQGFIVMTCVCVWVVCIAFSPWHRRTMGMHELQLRSNGIEPAKPNRQPNAQHHHYYYCVYKHNYRFNVGIATLWHC